MSIQQAIVTKFHGPTERRGSRISATAGSGHGRIFHSVDHSLNADENHRVAAETLRDRMGWKGELIQGATRNGYVFVFAPLEEGEDAPRKRYRIEFRKDGALHRWWQYHTGQNAALEHARASLRAEYPDGKGGTTADLIAVMREDASNA